MDIHIHERANSNSYRVPKGSGAGLAEAEVLGG